MSGILNTVRSAWFLTDRLCVLSFILLLLPFKAPLLISLREWEWTRLNARNEPPPETWKAHTHTHTHTHTNSLTCLYKSRRDCREGGRERERGFPIIIMAYSWGPLHSLAHAVLHTPWVNLIKKKKCSLSDHMYSWVCVRRVLKQAADGGAGTVCIFQAVWTSALLKRDSVQSQRYGCNSCSCLIVIASLALLQDAPAARPAHGSRSAAEKQPPCPPDFWP